VFDKEDIAQPEKQKKGWVHCSHSNVVQQKELFIYFHESEQQQTKIVESCWGQVDLKFYEA
jgi:hypothetical protein